MVRVVIIADIRLYAEGLAECLDRSYGIDVVGTAGELDGALALCRGEAPDILLVDMAAHGSFDVVHVCARDNPRVQIIALAVPETQRDVIACAEAGVAGYVSRDASLSDLRKAIRGAVRGELHCSPRIARGLLAEVGRRAPGHPGPAVNPECLTRRELEIVHLVARGMSNKEIASELHIGLSTVKNHVHNLLRKLGVRRRGEAAARLRGVLDGGT